MSSFVSIGQTPPRLPFFLMIVSRARDAMLFVDPCLASFAKSPFKQNRMHRERG